MPYKDPELRKSKAREYSQAWKVRNPGWQETHNARRRAAYAEGRTPAFVGVPKHVHAAHMRVYKAIKRGEIERPAICSECGREAFVEAAHENYTERLAIRWLCRSCHRSWDALHPKIEAPAPKTWKDARPTKLTPTIATEMRAAYAAGEPQTKLAVRFNVSRSLVGQVVRGELWA
jgi:hypothetical protein